jgi:GNAT superfamily N-acetyltransferase
MVVFIEATYSEIDEERLSYLNSLPEFQEFFLEWKVWESEYFHIVGQSELAGYFIVNSKENCLIEFYLEKKYLISSLAIFKKIIEDFDIRSVYCKSFDPLMLVSCLELSKSYEIDGILFRESDESKLPCPNELNPRFADIIDIPYLLQQNDGLYETPYELETMVKSGNLLLFEKASELFGCGFLTRIHPKFDYYDIGMWVNPNFRGQGHAVQIIAFLKNHCISQKKIPICGCAAQNIVSRHILEKNGFISKYRLLKFTV